MAIKYLTSVENFPTTKREGKNKLITENSLTRLINRLLDIDGYIITDNIKLKINTNFSGQIGNDTFPGKGGKHIIVNDDIPLNTIDFKDDKIEFSIRGYYFSVSINDLVDFLSTSKYLLGRIIIDKDNQDYPELFGQINNFTETDNGFTGDEYLGICFYTTDSLDNIPPVVGTPEFDGINGTHQNIVLPTNYDYYDLLLLSQEDEPVVCLPFNSLTKFDTHSISLIDGGEIK